MGDNEKLQPAVTKAATNNEKSFNHFMSRVRPSTSAMTFLQQPSVFLLRPSINFATTIYHGYHYCRKHGGAA